MFTNITFFDDFGTPVSQKLKLQHLYRIMYFATLCIYLLVWFQLSQSVLITVEFLFHRIHLIYHSCKLLQVIWKELFWPGNLKKLKTNQDDSKWREISKSGLTRRERVPNDSNMSNPNVDSFRYTKCFMTIFVLIIETLTPIFTYIYLFTHLRDMPMT